MTGIANLYLWMSILPAQFAWPDHISNALLDERVGKFLLPEHSIFQGEIPDLDKLFKAFQ